MAEEEKQNNSAVPKLEWRDYVALAVASLETTLLPFVIVIIVFVLVSYFLSLAGVFGYS